MVTKNYEIYKVTFSKLHSLSPLGCIGKSLAVKGKTGTENIKDGALHKRTIFSFSLTAAAFPDGVKSVERQSQRKNPQKLKKDFLKGERNLSSLTFTMPPTRHEGRCSYA